MPCIPTGRLTRQADRVPHRAQEREAPGLLLDRLDEPQRQREHGRGAPDLRLERGDTYSLATVDRDGRNLRALAKFSTERLRYIDWGTR
jgi:hypothetical protein